MYNIFKGYKIMIKLWFAVILSFLLFIVSDTDALIVGFSIKSDTSTNYAIRATSNTSYGLITDSGVSDFDLTSYTLEAWVYHSASYTLDGNDSLFEKANAYRIRVDNTTLYLSGSSTISSVFLGATDTSSFESLAAGWHHIAYVKDGNGLRLYINGSRVAEDARSVAQPDNDTNDNDLYIIGNQFTFSYWTWPVDEIRISDNARYTGASYTVPTANFTTDANTVGLYNCDDGSGTTLTDSSGNGNDITLTGTFSMQETGRF